jgi:dienelactone hydrolase
MEKNLLITLFVVLTLLASACARPVATEPLSSSETEPAMTDVSVTEAPVAEASPTASPSPVIQNLLPAQPQDVTIQTPQGRSLQGRYFPAAEEKAPLVVLIHWIMANQDDWQVVADWLQNRGQTATGACSMPIPCPWWDSAWFPDNGDRSYAVFTFTLSGCEANDGCMKITPEAWAEDANAAILYASQLEGIDPLRIVTAGASIGADAAIDSCVWLNSQGSKAHCAGTFQFSPGSYLGIDYTSQVTALAAAQPPIPAWCLYAENDPEAAPTCRAVSGSAYQKLEYAGNDHGMFLIQPGLAPKESGGTTLEQFLSFLDLTLEP